MDLPPGELLPPGCTLRPAVLSDAETIQAQRDAMFLDMGRAAEAVRATSAAALAWLRAALVSGEYGGVLVERGGAAVAGAGVIWQSLPPSPASRSGTRAYILNVYVSPQERGQGLARRAVEALLDACRERGVTFVSLHASGAGRPLYERLGFGPTEEMRLILEVGA